MQMYPSGQRGRAQDPLRSASQVQILPSVPYYSKIRINFSINSIVPSLPLFFVL